jgi:hypothetical protein
LVVPKIEATIFVKKANSYFLLLPTLLEFFSNLHLRLTFRTKNSLVLLLAAIKKQKSVGNEYHSKNNLCLIFDSVVKM